MPGEVITHGQMKMIRNQGFPFFNDEVSQGNLFIKFDVQFPKKGQLKSKQIKLLKKLLPGPDCSEIDYKSNKYEILDSYDDFDFNPKASGESNFSTYMTYNSKEKVILMKRKREIIMLEDKEYNANNLDALYIKITILISNFIKKT